MQLTNIRILFQDTYCKEYNLSFIINIHFTSVLGYFLAKSWFLIIFSFPFQKCFILFIASLTLCFADKEIQGLKTVPTESLKNRDWTNHVITSFCRFALQTVHPSICIIGFWKIRPFRIMSYNKKWVRIYT